MVVSEYSMQRSEESLKMANPIFLSTNVIDQIFGRDFLTSIQSQGVRKSSPKPSHHLTTLAHGTKSTPENVDGLKTRTTGKPSLPNETLNSALSHHGTDKKTHNL
jgi:hypothetical protein